jgi:CubicO group peptidase (beta-lactamase class C family)
MFTRRDILAGTAVVAGASLGHSLGYGAEARTLDDIVAGFGDERQRRGVPSISVALVEDGRVSLVQRGFCSASRRDSAGPETLYQAASISKTVAGLTALALSINNRVSLDADVSAYLKRWRLSAVPAVKPQAVSLRRLFGMTAGCSVPGYLGYKAGAALPDDIQILDGVPPSNSLPVRIVAPPGTMRAYSGGGCQVAQVAMEDATGRPFASLVNEVVLRPLAMTKSGFLQPPAPTQQAALARAHDGAGKEIAGGWHVYPEFAAAGLWSTPSDLARIIVAMIAAQRDDASAVFGRNGLSVMLTSVDNLGYGLGVALKGEGRDRIAMKRGNNLGFRDGLVACPASGQGAVVMTNGDAAEAIVDAALDALAQNYRWPQRAPWPE